MRKLTFCCKIDGSPLNLLSICLTRNLYGKLYLLPSKIYRALAVMGTAWLILGCRRTQWRDRHTHTLHKCVIGSPGAMLPPLNVWTRGAATGLHWNAAQSVLGSHPNHTGCNWWFWTNAPSSSVFCPARQITFILQPSHKQRLIPWMTKRLFFGFF